MRFGSSSTTLKQNAEVSNGKAQRPRVCDVIMSKPKFRHVHLHFLYQRIIQYKFFPVKQRVSQTFYLQLFICFTAEWILHHDTVPSHVSLSD